MVVDLCGCFGFFERIFGRTLLGNDDELLEICDHPSCNSGEAVTSLRAPPCEVVSPFFRALPELLWRFEGRIWLSEGVQNGAVGRFREHCPSSDAETLFYTAKPVSYRSCFWRHPLQFDVELVRGSPLESLPNFSEASSLC